MTRLELNRARETQNHMSDYRRCVDLFEKQLSGSPTQGRPFYKCVKLIA